jgi:protein tyrosine phosphatase (PTP) superfamily phosphohydrolase (DUF442 family)
VDFSQITDALYVGTTPTLDDYATLHQLGVRLVINMRADHSLAPDPHDPPLSILWLWTFDTPLLPIPLGALRRGATAALATIGDGGKVYVHCHFGRHRSVAMASAILIAQGHPVDEATRLIKQQREIADPDAWYIRWRIRRFAATWQNHT